MKPTFKTKCRDLWCGMYRHPWKCLGLTFAAFSVLWTLTEGITHFLPGITIEGPYALAVIVGLSVLFGINRYRKPSGIVIKVANSNTRIEVLFGDLFAQDGLRAFGVTRFFESELGVPVSERSLHGAFLKKCFGGGSKDFDEQIVRELADVQGENVAKTNGKTTQYPIGTTAKLKVDNDKYVLVALAEADLNTCKANSDPTRLWFAIHALWKRLRAEAGGYPVNLPLMGSGLSGVGLPSRDLLNLIILSAITETKIKRITDVIRIVLHRDQFEEFDLRDVKKHWEE